MSSSVSEVRLNTGDYLYREGDPNDCAFVVEKGEIVLFREVDGRRVNIETRCAGAIVGELSLITDQPRTVNVQALRPCRMYRIPSERIVEMYRHLDPMLRACVETSIGFAATLAESKADLRKEAVVAVPALEHAGDFLESLQMEVGLSDGLSRGEFSMMYQPIVRLDDGSTLGFEALMRWHHQTAGPIPPDRFIAVAEVMGSIHKLTEFALSEAAGTLRRIRNADPRLCDQFVSVNVSGLDIDREDFVDFLTHVTDLNDLDRHSIKLEITETALIPISGGGPKPRTTSGAWFRDLG